MKILLYFFSFFTLPLSSLKIASDFPDTQRRNHEKNKPFIVGIIMTAELYMEYSNLSERRPVSYIKKIRESEELTNEELAELRRDVADSILRGTNDFLMNLLNVRLTSKAIQNSLKRLAKKSHEFEDKVQVLNLILWKEYKRQFTKEYTEEDLRKKNITRGKLRQDLLDRMIRLITNKKYFIAEATRKMFAPAEALSEDEKYVFIVRNKIKKIIKESDDLEFKEGAGVVTWKKNKPPEDSIYEPMSIGSNWIRQQDPETLKYKSPPIIDKKYTITEDVVQLVRYHLYHCGRSSINLLDMARIVLGKLDHPHFTSASLDTIEEDFNNQEDGKSKSPPPNTHLYTTEIPNAYSDAFIELSVSKKEMATKATEMATKVQKTFEDKEELSSQLAAFSEETKTPINTKYYDDIWKWYYTTLNLLTKLTPLTYEKLEKIKINDNTLHKETGITRHNIKHNIKPIFEPFLYWLIGSKSRSFTAAVLRSIQEKNASNHEQGENDES